MEENRKCLACGKTYIATRYNSKYCSRDCGYSAHKTNARERDRKVKQKRKQVQNNPKSLSEIEAEARAIGMNYGHYVSKMGV